MSKTIRMNTNKKIIVAVIAAVFGSVLVVGLLGNALGFFDLDSIDLQKRNEANYIKTWTLKTRDDGNGLKVTVDEEDGYFKLSGKNSGGSPIEYEYAEVNLPAGTYTLDCGNVGGSKSTYYMAVEDTSGNVLGYFNFTGNEFTLSEATTVKVVVVVCGETTVNATFKPIIYTGEEAQSFYA